MRSVRDLRSGACLLFLLMALAVTVAAHGLTLAVGSVTGAPGSAVAVPLSVSSPASGADLFFEVDYDPTVLSLTSVAPGAALGARTLDWNSPSPGKVLLVLYSSSCNALASGALADLDFTIDPAAPAGKSAVTLASASGSDPSAATVTMSTADGGVTVGSSPAPVAIPTLSRNALLALGLLLLLVAVILLERRRRAVHPGIGVAVVLLFLALGAQYARAATTPGDANNDGKVNGTDAAWIADLLVGKRASLPGDGDCNSDGKIDIRDVACVEASVCNKASNAPPVLAPIPDQTVLTDRLLSVQGHATDPNAGDTLTFSLSGAPVGMSIDPATGSVIWVPQASQTGIHGVTMSVQDQHGASDSQSFSVDVTALGKPPVIQAIASQTLRIGQSLNLTAVATDPDPGDTLTFSLSLAPGGMTINATTGAVAWTPAAGDLGAHDVTVNVTDSTGLSDFTSFTVTVVAVNAAPVAVNDQYDVSGGLQLSVAAPGVMANDSDPNGDSLTASLVSGPSYGAVNLNPDGSFTYQRTPGTTEPKQLYVIGDNTGYSYFFNTKTPLVADLDGNGVPELIFVSWFGCGSHLVAFHGDDGSSYFDTPSDCSASNANDWRVLDGGDALAVGDLDGDGKPEILAIDGRFRRRFYAFDHTGKYLWTSQDIIADQKSLVSTTTGFGYLTLADLDGDGKPEILVGYKGTLATNSQGKQFVTVFNHDGTIRWTAYGNNAEGGEQYTAPVHVADLNLDGKPEILFGEDVYDADGNHLWSAHVNNVNTVAVVNLNDDPYPEIVYKDGSGFFYAYDHYGKRLWGPVSAPGSNGSYIGSFVVGDVNGNGWPDLVGRNYIYLSALDRNGNLLWKKTIGTGTSVPTVFDLNGDGHPEVIYTDAGGNLQILDGATGKTLHTILSIGSDSGGEQVIADVNGDGAANIVEANGSWIYSPALAIYGAASGAWMPSRPIWNEFDYHITNVNPDGTIPAHELPNWLQPGLNNYRVNVPLPGEKGTTDSFTYKVSDGSLDSNVATVSLPVKNAFDPKVKGSGNPPVILSTPVTQATASVPYEYGLLARDPDVGDTLTYGLDNGDPPGMTIDSYGIVRWTPTEADLGAHLIGLRVTDAAGHITHQVYTLTVSQPVPVPDVVGMTPAAAESTLAGAGFKVGTVTQANDPTIPVGDVAAEQPAAGTAAAAGSAVDLTTSLGPGPQDLDQDHDGYTPRQGDCNDHDPTIHPGAYDTPGDGVDQNCDGVDGTLAPVSVAVSPPTLTLFAGESVDLSAYGVAADGTSWNVGSLATWSSTSAAASVNSSGQVTATSAGTAMIEASYSGKTGTATVNVVAAVASDTVPPVVAITAPTDGQAIYGPTTITGSASDANFVRYELAISPAGLQTFTLLSTGTAPVTNGDLGTLDPTLMLNGLYKLRLTVFDAGGNQSSAEVTVQVAGNQKVGNFTLSFTDLKVPMAGIPIEIQRTYDSRDKRQGDFGVGWRLGLKTLTMTCTQSLGTGWEVVKAGLAYDLVATRLHRCTLTMPSGRVEAFDFVPDPASSILQQFSLLRGKFVSESGTLGTLASLDNMNFEILDPQPGPVELRDDITSNVYDPKTFVYTTVGQTQYTLSMANGLEEIEDPNGNSLTIGPNGITSSSGKSVTFARDAEGRITSITDPASNVRYYTYSASGDLASYTDEGGNTTHFFYNFDHGLVKIEDPLGRPVARNDYDAQGRLIATTDAAGRTIQYSYDLSGKKETITDTDGGVTELDYDDHGNVTRAVDPLGGVTTNTYDGDDDLLSTTDPLGDTTTRTYDASRDLLSETDPLGHKTTYAYNAWGEQTSQTDPLGRTTTTSYDSRGNAIQVTAPDGSVTKDSYDTRGGLVAIVDPLGNTTRIERDALDLPTLRIDPRGGQHAISYDAVGNPIKETDARGFSVSFTDDPRGLLTKVTDPLGNVTQYDYDATGVLAKTVDPGGAVITQQTDAEGRLTAETDPLGKTSTLAYDLKGNLEQVVDALSRKTRFAYDKLDRRTSKTLPGGAVVKYAYDAAGRLISRTDPLGNETQFAYDAAGDLVKRTDALGNSMEFVYDAAGQTIAQTDPLGHTTHYSYDAAGRIVKVTYPDGSTIALSYDAKGNRTGYTDELGHHWSYAYDENGNLISVKDSLGDTTTYSWDQQNNLIGKTDANGETTRFEYDDNGRRVKTILPDGGVESRTFDAAGNLSSTTDADGNRVTFSHDADGHLLSKNYPNGDHAKFTYTATGKVATATNAEGTWTFTYDPRDRIANVSQPGGVTLSYSYDPDGDLTAMKLARGAVSHTFTYSYDALRRLISVGDSLGGTYDFAYDAAGRRTSLVSSNGTKTAYGYDTRNRLTSIELSKAGVPFERYTYTLDAAGDKKHVDLLDGSSVDFTYDALRRLVHEVQRDAAASPIYDTSYTYDAAGNRLSRKDGLTGAITTYDYGPADRLLSAGSTTYSYDAKGNLVSQTGPLGTRTFRYDPENRLLEVDLENGTPVTYTYDPFGDRISKTGAAGTTDYVVDSANRTGYSQVVAEYDHSSGLELALYLFGDDLLGEIRSGVRYDYHVDGQGNVRLLTDPAGNVVDSYRFSAFGEQLAENSSVPNVHLFKGERRDPETGLDYMRARVYAPSLGRFLTRDPAPGALADPLSLNKYVFGKDDPVNLRDPSGQLTLTGVAVTMNVISILATATSVVAAFSGHERVAAIAGDVGIAAGFVSLFAGASQFVIDLQGAATRRGVEEELQRIAQRKAQQAAERRAAADAARGIVEDTAGNDLLSEPEDAVARTVAEVMKREAKYRVSQLAGSLIVRTAEEQTTELIAWVKALITREASLAALNAEGSVVGTRTAALIVARTELEHASAQAIEQWGTALETGADALGLSGQDLKIVDYLRFAASNLYGLALK